MVEATARHRLERAAKSHTRPAAQERQFAVGDMVDFFRPPGQKDLPGWRGSAKVCDLTSLEHGNVGVMWQGRHLLCRPQDLRHSMFHMSFLRCSDESIITHPLQTLIHTVSGLPSNTTLLIGWIQHTDKWVLSRATYQHYQTYKACLALARQVMYDRKIVSIRLAHDVPSLPPLRGYVGSHVMWWPVGSSCHYWVDADPAAQLDLSAVSGHTHTQRDNCITVSERISTGSSHI